MAVELGASRLLAPYFSSSQIVWTIIIGTIMIAMALGNIYGGRSVDKNPNPDKLYGRILVAAVWIAANTIGSIIGTFVPTFISIPAVGTAMTFLIFSGILLLLGLIYFISYRRGIIKSIVAVVLFAAFFVCGNLMGFAFWESGLAYEGESVYNYLQVKDNEQMTTLSTNVLFGVQSVYMKNGGLTGMYYDYALAAPFMTSGNGEKDILILGMGSGTYAKQCREYLYNANIEGVEIDEKITGLAREYFELPEDIPVTTYDGRAFLNVSDKKYDVIMVDAYQDITIPFQMSSVEFFREVKSHLKENGVMVVNMNMQSDKENSINDYLGDTIASVFNNVYTADVSRTTNRELFVSDDENMIDLFNENINYISDEALKTQMETVSKRLKPYYGGGRILTDDKAPVELLGMRVIDDLISRELAYYKNIFKTQGIEGLLNSGF